MQKYFIVIYTGRKLTKINKNIYNFFSISVTIMTNVICFTLYDSYNK